MSLMASVQAKVAAARKALRSATGSVEGIRAEILKLQSERRSVEGAPVVIDEAASALDETITRLLAGIHTWTTPPDLIASAAHGQPADVRALSDQHRLAIAVLALQPLLREQFHRALAQHYETLQPGLPAADRQQRLRELGEQVGMLEREEEALLQELAGAGVSIDRRPDVSPSVLLGIDA
jgi:hypothetical protein